MKRLCITLGLAVMMVLPAAAMAQSGGAIIERGTGEGWGYEWNGAQTLLIYSTMSNFYCGEDSAAPRDMLFVTTPAGAVHYRDRGTFFARVYAGTEAELWATGEPLDFICGRPFWAEGILQSIWHDNDQTAIAPGTNVWGHGLSGALTDLTGTCRSQMVAVHFFVQWRILAAWDEQPGCWDYTPSCVELVVLKGPRVTCTR